MGIEWNPKPEERSIFSDLEGWQFMVALTLGFILLGVLIFAYSKLMAWFGFDELTTVFLIPFILILLSHIHTSKKD